MSAGAPHLDPTMRLSLALAFLVSASAVSAQTSPQTTYQPPPPGYKDPGTATLFGVLITGGGHFYSGETGKGLALLGIGTGAYVVGAVATASSCNSYGDSCDNVAPLLLGAGVALGTWIYGIVDADDAARRTNAENGYDVPMALAPTALRTDDGTRPGLAMRVRF